ncbi:MAG: T9SS type A sorting domain-containing protein [Bacteroidota bacterium]|nr:T9SS type A sorting domain-containing protein [Bacteroidota bacterium]MDP4233579.1 T9SS type A sorting domain-containing protein [Bacteroidota bacterium]MDP4243647.1 T9SS type A sorting domain-containing protein [Bacteroidota bacterium]MDP4287766.1 T9SS type A sorting domain-containing protein [Bacteroidota bacterium]
MVDILVYSSNNDAGQSMELVEMLRASGKDVWIDQHGIVGPMQRPTEIVAGITPNPATDNINIMSSGVRTAEIGIYDLLGKEIASSKTTTWKLDAAGIVAGSYVVRIVGESNSGEEIAIWRRVVIAR